MSFLKNRIMVVCALFCVLALFGCARVKECVKRAAGLSTVELENARGDSLKQSVAYGYNACFNKTLEIFNDMQSYVYARDAKKKMIALYVSAADTTPVGVFFREIDAHNTEVEVVSQSAFAKEHISSKLFVALVKSLNPVKPEEKK